MSEKTLATQTSIPWIAFRPGVLDGEGRLVCSRCPSCDAHFFPGRQVCSRCLTQDLETVTLSESGTLYTYTVVHQAAPGFDVPYVLGYVDFPEGLRILGQIAGLGPEGARMGMRLDVRVELFGQDDEDRQILGFRFHPTEGSYD